MQRNYTRTKNAGNGGTKKPPSMSRNLLIFLIVAGSATALILILVFTIPGAPGTPGAPGQQPIVENKVTMILGTDTDRAWDDIGLTSNSIDALHNFPDGKTYVVLEVSDSEEVMKQKIGVDTLYLSNGTARVFVTKDFINDLPVYRFIVKIGPRLPSQPEEHWVMYAGFEIGANQIEGVIQTLIQIGV